MLERPLHAECLTLLPATAGDADSTWRFLQLQSVNEWLTACRADPDAYPKLFSEPARLATTAPLISDFMLRREATVWVCVDEHASR